MAVLNTRDKINEALGEGGKQAHISTGRRGMANATTEATVKEILKHGTPDWFRHPNDYKDLAKEDFLRSKQNSAAQVREFKLPNQKIFTDEAARMINPLGCKELLNKLRENGLRCCIQANPNSPKNTAGLHAIQPGRDQLGLQLVTTVQIPGMYEWSVLREDAHGLPAGEKYIGWRNVAAALVTKGFWSEEKVEKVFGRPPIKEHTGHYYKALWQARNPHLCSTQSGSTR